MLYIISIRVLYISKTKWQLPKHFKTKTKILETLEPCIWNYKSNIRKLKYINFLTSRIISGAVKSWYELTDLDLTMFGEKHESLSDLRQVCVRFTLNQCHIYPESVSYLPWVSVRLTLSLGQTYPESVSYLSWVSFRLNLNLHQTYPETI